MTAHQIVVALVLALVVFIGWFTTLMVDSIRENSSEIAVINSKLSAIDTKITGHVDKIRIHYNLRDQ